MKNKYIISIFLSVISIISFSISSYATTDDTYYYSTYNDSSYSTNSAGYEITAYDINMDVSEDNIYNITETINVNFTQYKHGIIRKIPLRNTIERADGTTSTNVAKITDIKVSDTNSISTADGNKCIKIGDANRTITGTKQYVISYKYDIGNDKLKDMDEFYFNLIGNSWDTSIDLVTFTINMPKSFDYNENTLGFSSGRKGTIGTNNITYSVNGSTISGKYTGGLNDSEAFTVRLELPDKYFTYKYDFSTWLVPIMAVVFVIISLYLWYTYGKDFEVIETVEFYPPDNLNSTELGYIFKGKVENKDVISLLIYLANKKYLKIEEQEEKVLFSTVKTFKIIKLKDYDGQNEIEKIFMNGLFKTKDVVTELDLENKFYKTISKISLKMDTNKNKDKIFEKESSGKTKWLVLMIIITFLAITIKPMITYGEYEMLFVGLLFPGIGFSVLFAMVLGKTSIGEKFFGLVWGSMFGGMPWAMAVLPALKCDASFMNIYIIGLICIAIMCVLVTLMPKRTIYGTKMLGKIKGFKRFLETAEKEELEQRVMQDPEYFYNILPYTYVLGVSKTWIEKFKTIGISQPDWYNGYGSTFNITTFGNSLERTMSSATSSMSSSPSSSGSGGSSGGGGGSSGGGSGRRRRIFLVIKLVIFGIILYNV